MATPPFESSCECNVHDSCKQACAAPASIWSVLHYLAPKKMLSQQQRAVILRFVSLSDNLSLGTSTCHLFQDRSPTNATPKNTREEDTSINCQGRTVETVMLRQQMISTLCWPHGCVPELELTSEQRSMLPPTKVEASKFPSRQRLFVGKAETDVKNAFRGLPK